MTASPELPLPPEEPAGPNRMKVLLVMSVILGLFHLYTAFFGLLPVTTQRGFHWGILGVMALLTHPLGGWKNPGRAGKMLLDFVLIALFIAATLYLLLTWEQNAFRVGPPPLIEVFLGCAMILLTLEAARRTSGIVLPLIAVVFLFYAMAGPYFPGILRHRGYGLSRLAYFLFAGPNGIYGIPMGVSSTYIILFVIFGAFLSVSKGGDFFMDISLALTRRFNAGTAKSSVIGSAFMGTMSGSPVANAVTTGAITIPLMKKDGYKPEVACAVEAVASTGGMIMPPVMGAAAFIMAEYLQVSYTDVALSALLPSVLYFFSVYCMIDLYSRRHGIAVKKGGMMDWSGLWATMKDKGHLSLPLVFLIGALLIGWSPMKAVTWSIFAMIIVSWFKTETRITPARFVEALRDGVANMVPVTSACASAGIILGVVSITGIGSSVSSILLTAFGSSLAPVLITSMFISLVLGMGLPATAVYLILATLVTPALEKLGVVPMAAHMFVFYYGIISTITPPVALTAYAAAGLGKADPNKSGYYAFYLGIASFIIPFVFIYAPELLLYGSSFAIVYRFAVTLVAVYALACALTGFFKRPIAGWQRVLLGIAAISLIIPHTAFDAIGLLLAAVVLVPVALSAKKEGA